MKASRRNFIKGAGVAAIAAPGIAGLATAEKGVEADSVRKTSLWTDEITGLPAQPQFEGEREVDVAIVGAGFTGLATAYYIKQFKPDWSVVVLESHTIGSGASSRNSGAVYAKHVGIDDNDMPQRGLNRLMDFIQSQNIDCDFDKASTLRVFHSEDAFNQAKTELNPGDQVISADALKDKAGTDYYAGAIEEQGFFKVQPAKLVAGHAKAALTAGAEIYEKSPVMNISNDPKPVLTTPKGKITAKQLCVATNAYTPRLGLLDYQMYPIHQYTLATRKLSAEEIHSLGLDQWDLRFEPRMLPVTFSLTPSGRFFVRMVLGYASHDSCEWKDEAGARQLAEKLFLQRYPQLKDIGFEKSWHGVTGHTSLMKTIAGPIRDKNVHASVAYNGLGIMPAHNFGYLTACQMTATPDPDLAFLTGTSGQAPMPKDFYRSLILKPFMSLMKPV